MATKIYQGKRFDALGEHAVTDTLTLEEPLQIVINGAPFTLTMRTPGDDLDLVRGLIHSEVVLNHPDFHPEMEFSAAGNQQPVTIAKLTLPENYLGPGIASGRSLLSASSCGMCGKTELDEVAAGIPLVQCTETITPELISGMFESMHAHQQDFKRSGGTHAAAIFDFNGALIGVREDIGRHNAVDKIIGHLLLNKLQQKVGVMTVSGRISYEIVIKVFRAGIPVLAAVSAPSSLAVDYARALGITLLGFCREDRLTCYTHPERIGNSAMFHAKINLS
jgi:FdhD protein